MNNPPPLDPRKLPNQPINPLGQPDAFSPEEEKHFAAAAEEVDWLDRLLKNPDFIRYLGRQLQRMYAEREDALDPKSNAAEARDSVVAYNVLKSENAWAEETLKTALETVRDRGRRAEEMNKRKMARLEQMIHPHATQPNAL